MIKAPLMVCCFKNQNGTHGREFSEKHDDKPRAPGNLLQADTSEMSVQ
jgi:hypothetical protein